MELAVLLTAISTTSPENNKTNYSARFDSTTLYLYRFPSFGSESAEQRRCHRCLGIFRRSAHLLFQPFTSSSWLCCSFSAVPVDTPLQRLSTSGCDVTVRAERAGCSLTTSRHRYCSVAATLHQMAAERGQGEKASICPSICPSVFLSIFQSIYLSIYLKCRTC